MLKPEGKHRKIFPTPGQRIPLSTAKTKPVLELESMRPESLSLMKM